MTEKEHLQLLIMSALMFLVVIGMFANLDKLYVVILCAITMVMPLVLKILSVEVANSAEEENKEK